MSNGTLVIDYQPDAVVVEKVVHVPLRIVGVGDIALVREQIHRIVVINSGGGVVDGPE